MFIFLKVCCHFNYSFSHNLLYIYFDSILDAERMFKPTTIISAAILRQTVKECYSFHMHLLYLGSNINSCFPAVFISMLVVHGNAQFRHAANVKKLNRLVVY